MKLKNKIVVITGASSGIGKAAAIHCSELGAIVILIARNTKNLKAVATAIINNGHICHYYIADLTVITAVEKLVEQIIKTIGHPDIIINSAGSGEWLSLSEAKNDHFTTTIDSPYITTATTCKSFYDKLPNTKKCHFIILNSAACYFSFPKATGYTAARWALLGFSKALQADLYQSNISVSMIALGKVNTPYFINNPISEQRIPKIVNWLIPTLTTDETSVIIEKTILRPKNTVIKPQLLAFFVKLNTLFPKLFNWLLRIQ